MIIVETPIPKAKRSGIGKVNNPASGGFNTPQLAAEPVSKACFGVHTRDCAGWQKGWIVYITLGFRRVTSIFVIQIYSLFYWQLFCSRFYEGDQNNSK